MQSVSQHDFARVPAPQISRSRFDRSSPYKTTFNSGDLFPIFYDEALPGDSFKLNASFFARLNTPIVPYMDNAYFETFFFEVPMRQLWDNWQRFNGEQLEPGDSTDFLIPQVVAPGGAWEEGSLADFFGLPLGVNISVSALPFRAYNHIYNTWFRDENLQGSLDFVPGDGPDSPAAYNVVKRGKRFDYFTSALPWPQKSDQGAVTIPLGTRAPINADGSIGDDVAVFSTVAGDNHFLGAATAQVTLDPIVAGGSTALYADLTEATAATINQLRQSIAVQRLFEKDARGGTRYIEILKNHFKVDSPDLRLQRPGYLGGGSTPVNINPIAQTQASGDATDTPQANLAAIGTVTANGHGFTKSFTEHTIIIGLACVRADLTYSRGINRSWSRLTRFDHFWPELATIGEQEVLNKEIWATGIDVEDEAVWGYQERFAEYRYKPGLICGKFRSTDPQSLDFWHLSQDFTTLPVLGPDFISEDPPFDRVIATPEEPQFKLDAYFNLNCVRPMPMYGIPGLTRL